MDKRYLLKRDGIYYLNFKMPIEFGGKTLRISLKTDRLDVASRVRDQFILPILYNSSVIDILKGMAKTIATLEQETISHIENFSQIISNAPVMNLKEISEKYFKFLESSGKRPATVFNYKNHIQKLTSFFGEDKNINHFTKSDASKFRDELQKYLSPTRISSIFGVVRLFFRWCEAEGLAIADIDKRFTIKLPTVKVEHTQLIPPEKADQAVSAIPHWLIAPMIARYTGMRWMEIYRLCASVGNNKIITKHGIQCIFVDKDSKTHTERVIPIADKLLPYLTTENFKEVVKKNKKYNSKYNAQIKKIEDCQSCSFHSWRVYANTMMMEAGVDQAIRMAILGHTTGDNVHAGYTAIRIEQMKKGVDMIP